ncbi:hypothetical protein JXB11_05000 [Candidatus Woesearchaeota archaeon]|nr:hypothetical protein [Candidatus Woesearchaeota archaeon]
MKPKKADLKVVTAIIAAILVGIIILILIFGKMGPTLTDVAERQACANDIAIKSHTTIFTESPYKYINCHTHFIDVSTDGIVKDGKKINEQQVNPDDIKRLFANEMYDCWYQFGAGQNSPFGGQTAISCIICSQIEIDDFADEGELSIPNGELYDFDEWIRNHRVGSYAVSASDSREFYYDYFGRNKDPQMPYYERLQQSASVNDYADPRDIHIETGNTYIIGVIGLPLSYNMVPFYTKIEYMGNEIERCWHLY